MIDCPMIKLPDLNKDYVSGTDYGTGTPFVLTIREFIAENADDFEDKEFAFDFLMALATEGHFDYPASMETVRITLIATEEGVT